jgi:hypothetical protein
MIAGERPGSQDLGSSLDMMVSLSFSAKDAQQKDRTLNIKPINWAEPGYHIYNYSKEPAPIVNCLIRIVVNQACWRSRRLRLGWWFQIL